MNTSVIVRTCNDGKVLEECLQKVFTQQLPGEKEFILIDEASKDNTLGIVEKFPFDRVIRLGEFLSGSHTLNTAARQCRHEYIVQTLGHTIPADSMAFRHLLSHLEGNQCAASYGRQLPHPMGNIFRNVDFREGYGNTVKKSDVISHSFFAFKRSVWRQFPFDEALRGAEDKPWAYTLRKEGYHILYDARAAVFHFHDFQWAQLFLKPYISAQTHRKTGLSRRSYYANLPGRVMNDFRTLEKKSYLFLSPLYRGVQGVAYFLGWHRQGLRRKER